MKKGLIILALIGILSCLISGCEKNGKSASSDAYWTTYSNFQNPPDSLNELGVKGPFYINEVAIGEESVGVELARVYFTKDQTSAYGTNKRDHSKYWVEVIKDAEGTPVSVKVSSNAANDFTITVNFHIVETDMPAYFQMLRSDDGVHSPDGAVIPDPYEDPENPIAGDKELNFKCTYEDGNEIKNKLEEAGFETYSMRYVDGTYTVSTLKELEGRAKIYETVLKPEDWTVDKGKSKGNKGFYNKASDYTGSISINWTLNNIPFTIEIKDAKLEKLEDGEDETSYTMSGTAEIGQKSFALGDMVFRLNDKQSKPFSEEYAFKIEKEPSPAIIWEYVEEWEYIDDTYGTVFLLVVSYTTRNGPTDFSSIPIESLDKIEGSDTMSFLMPACGGTAAWSFEAK
ncbi:MAG: hypothetical protein AB7E30_07305 [Lawsonibacter sp.]